MIAGLGCLWWAIKKNPYFRLKKAHFRFDKSIAKDIVKLGIPLALQYSLIAISCTVLQGYVNRYGAVTVAAFTVTGRIEQLIHSPFGSLGSAVSTYSGQNHGAHKDNRVIEGYKKSLTFIVAFALLMLPVMFFCSEDLVRLFVNDPAVVKLGATAMRITSLFYFFLGIIYVTRGLLNGVGDAFFTFINGAVEICGRILFPLLLSMIPTIGIYGIWWATGLTWFATGLICVLRLVSWRKKRALSSRRKVQTSW
jgi:Na+-driven multidrug efflux pump